MSQFSHQENIDALRKEESVLTSLAYGLNGQSIGPCHLAQDDVGIVSVLSMERFASYSDHFVASPYVGHLGQRMQLESLKQERRY